MNARGSALPVRLLAACAGLLIADTLAGAADATVTPRVTLRDAGYLLGDLLDERIELALPPGYTLDADSLPLPGRVAPWLELRSARIEAAHGDANVVLLATYQIFAETEQVARVPLPGFKLRLRSTDGTQALTVPEQSFLLSPALPPTLSDEDRELKPTSPPEPLPRAAAIAGLGAALLVAAACAALLLWLHDRLPFLPRAPGPFATLWRRWRRRARRGLSDAECGDLLRDWHAALNRAAGETLYAATFARLFARAPHLEGLRTPVEAAFHASWAHFYAAAPAPRADMILDLVRAAAARERGVPC